MKGSAAKERLLHHWRASGTITDTRLLEAFSSVPRENFVLSYEEGKCYRDCPLPILCGQTISQPTTVMLMSQALSVSGGMNILEIGTGSGYQAAILSKLTGESGRIVSIEYYDDLARFAEANLEKTGCGNVEVVCGDGGLGCPEKAPFDRIIVTCACPLVPPPLPEQLSDGGILVLPLESELFEQMQVITKTGAGLTMRSIGSFRFVPLMGKFSRSGTE